MFNSVRKDHCCCCCCQILIEDSVALSQVLATNIPMQKNLTSKRVGVLLTPPDRPSRRDALELHLAPLFIQFYSCCALLLPTLSITCILLAVLLFLLKRLAMLNLWVFFLKQ